MQAVAPPNPSAALDDLITVVPLNINPDSTSARIVSFGGSSSAPVGFEPSDLDAVNSLARILLTNPALVFPPVPQATPNPRSMKVSQVKEEGNVHFRKGQWADAVRLYTLSAEIAATRPIFESNLYARDELALALCNRSAAYLGAKDYVNALVDAEAVIKLKTPWVKGYFRKGKALAAAGRLDEARDTILLGLQFDPSTEVGSAFFLGWGVSRREN